MTIEKRVSDKGWRLIQDWIKATHNEDHPYNHDARACEAWCNEAEEQMSQGNPPTVEMPSNATASGHTETFTVPDNCIYEVEVDE